MKQHDFYDREDGLAHCKICHGGEGSLPRECPGREMTAEEQDAVYAGNLEFFQDKWWKPLDTPILSC